MADELLTVFHFNDVYNIQPYDQEPKGGAAYFHTLLHREKNKYKHPLTLFSGDAFSPSPISAEFDGENMLKPLNSFGIDLACYGNHEFDYELERVIDLTSRTNFPWLLSNIYDKRTERRLAEGLETYIFNVNGVKIGVFSLAEKEWIDTLYPIYKEICTYIPFIDFAETMVVKLREQEKCDLVIALTHMMKYNDIKLANKVKGIDLILGGHDHHIVHEMINDTVLVKSGNDFKNFSIIRVQRNNGKEIPASKIEGDITVVSNKWWTFEVELKTVHHENEKIEPNKELNEYVE
jgi:5'-nucleotidase